jgi:DNA (cytosine-5)-methyltransferase 1
MAESRFNRREQGKMSDPELTVVDLFCGAGGLSLGFEEAGFHVEQAIDNRRAAVLTYNENLAPVARREDLSESLNIPNATVFVGGPPCQGFSSAGVRRLGDVRNSLVARFSTIIAEHKPEAFMFENVEGFLTAHGGAFVIDLLEPLLNAGYRIHLRKVNAANFGVPQHRKRVIAIGGRGWDPSFPRPTHTAIGAPGALLASETLPLAPTVTEAFEGLPPAARKSPGYPSGHYFNELADSDLKRAQLLLAGQTMRDLPESLRHDSYRRRAFRRVKDGTPTERRGGAPAGIRRLHPDQPSKAITSGAKSEFLHPTEDRPLTLRECARLQTFPDDHLFVGKGSEQWELIGNAVPPLLAYSFAMSLRSDLRRPLRTNKKGALLTFAPTLSDGCSPALKQVIQLVRRTFSVSSLENEQLPLWH